jgi:hypothetical protein
MSFNLTDDDLVALEKQRLERFRSFFCDTLPFCFLHLNRKHTLTIHCSEPWLVDQLLCEIDQLAWYAWIVVGAYRVSLYFAQEEIHTTKTVKQSKRGQKSQGLKVKH